MLVPVCALLASVGCLDARLLPRRLPDRAAAEGDTAAVGGGARAGRGLSAGGGRRMRRGRPVQEHQRGVQQLEATALRRCRD